MQQLVAYNHVLLQISCLRSEQTQLTRSLEKERQRASESRQEFLALKEEADTHKGHVNQVKEEMTELKRKHKRELQETWTQRELLQQVLLDRCGNLDCLLINGSIYLTRVNCVKRVESHPNSILIFKSYNLLNRFVEDIDYDWNNIFFCNHN